MYGCEGYLVRGGEMSRTGRYGSRVEGGSRIGRESKMDRESGKGKGDRGIVKRHEIGQIFVSCAQIPIVFHVFCQLPRPQLLSVAHTLLSLSYFLTGSQNDRYNSPIINLVGKKHLVRGGVQLPMDSPVKPTPQLRSLVRVYICHRVEWTEQKKTGEAEETAAAVDRSRRMEQLDQGGVTKIVKNGKMGTHGCLLIYTKYENIVRSKPKVAVLDTPSMKQSNKWRYIMVVIVSIILFLEDMGSLASMQPIGGQHLLEAHVANESKWWSTIPKT